MSRYFYLQFKRALRIFPFVFLVTLVIVSGILLILSSFMGSFKESEENQVFKIAVTGDTDSEYIKWGMTAMQTFDESRFAIEFVDMTEDDAEKSLAKGQISAYVVLPENFVEKAIEGIIDPIKYVTTSGNGGLVTTFKNEITELVTDMVLYSQKGSYGIGDAMIDNKLYSAAGGAMEQLSIEYVDVIFSRSNMYEVEELGISDGLNMNEYYVCGVVILLIMLVGLPFVTICVRSDYAMNRLLLSRGYSNFSQIIFEYISHFISMLILTAVICIVTGVFIYLKPDTIGSVLTIEQLAAFSVRLIPVVMLVSSFNLMIFTCSSNVISGVLMHFFSSLGLCYITGCIYPIYAFPLVLQRASNFLPTGVMRNYLSGSFTYEKMLPAFFGVLGYSVLFFAVSFAVRRAKTLNRRGG